MSNYLTTRYFLLLFLLTSIACIHPAYAQLGVAVATDGEQIFVSKEGGAYGGLAQVFVYEKKNGAWVNVQTLHAPGSTESGEALTPSLILTDDWLLVGAADPEIKLGAHAFENVEGFWAPVSSIALDEQVHMPTQHESMALNDFFRYVYPPARLLGYGGGMLAIAAAEGIHLYREEENQFSLDPLQPVLRSQSVEEAGQFGASIAVIGGHHIVAGAPRNTGSGTVHFFTPQIDASWGEMTLASPDSNAIGFGSSLLSLDQLLIVGAPGNASTPGMVYVFKLGEDVPLATLFAPESENGNLFGSALAHTGDELWIGAPGSQGGSGRIYRYARGEAAWSLIDHFEGADEQGLGATLTSAGNLALAGAPGADGEFGRARIYEQQESGNWEATAWLYPDRLTAAITGEQHRCEEGEASGFACSNVDLTAFLPIESIGGKTGERVSDLWGWTDPQTGKEYALIGRTGGAAIIDVTDPILPLYLGLVPANPTPTRDLKVRDNVLYFTGDGAGEHGLVVFDLTRIRSLETIPSKLEPDFIYRGIASAHNLVMDAESGFAYAVGSSRGGETCGGGLHMIDLSEPLEPSFAGCYTDTIGLFSAGRTHDAQCVLYRGPDERYQGQQICFVSNETALRIVDVTDKSNPNPLSAARYPRTAYVHQGWLTEDQKYFYLDDELDEIVGMTGKTRTIIWDVADLEDPVLVTTFEGNTTATDHNLYVKGDRMYQANYQGGFRIWDISDPIAPKEIGFFDTTPFPGNPPGFSGAWTAYPYFESGTVIVSSMDEGLFVVKPREQEQVP